MNYVVLVRNDVVLARSHLLTGEPYGLQKRINANPGVVQAPVVSWSTGYDIYRRLAQFCQPPYAIPSTVPRVSGSVLVVFDYDWSLINENSTPSSSRSCILSCLRRCVNDVLSSLRGQRSWTICSATSRRTNQRSPQT